jgi:hypothetical protein
MKKAMMRAAKKIGTARTPRVPNKTEGVKSPGEDKAPPGVDASLVNLFDSTDEAGEGDDSSLDAQTVRNLMS